MLAVRIAQLLVFLWSGLIEWLKWPQLTIHCVVFKVGGVGRSHSISISEILASVKLVTELTNFLNISLLLTYHVITKLKTK